MKITPHWLLLASLTPLIACHKNSENKVTTPGTDTAVTVYASGYSSTGLINTATFWKNDTGTLLPPVTTADTGSIGYSVAVSGTDVYIAGTSPHGAVVWKNGVEQVLSPTGQAYSIALSGTDVYVAGTQTVPNNNYLTNAVYWKNGQPTILSPELAEAGATWVTIAGSDIYVCGYGLTAKGYYRALYWKNGAEVWMDPDRASSPDQILVQGTDVYVTGTLNTIAACYWKNGQLVLLPGEGPSQSASGIAIAGTDVYVTGAVYNTSIADFNAVYWKNGQFVQLTDSLVHSSAGPIAVLGNDIYIGGFAGQSSSQGNPVYWKNGNLVSWNNAGTAEFGNITSIWVTGK